MYGQEECITTLAKLGANLEAENDSGETPLIRASRWGHTDAVTALLKAGASYTAKDAVSRHVRYHGGVSLSLKPRIT